MEQTPIQKAFAKVEQLMTEKPWHTSIFDAIIELKTVTDQQILKNLQDIYWDDWENTAANQEFNNMKWRVKLENNLLKKELGIEVSISNLILQISWALETNLTAVKTEKEEIKEEVQEEKEEVKEEEEKTEVEEVKEEDSPLNIDLIQFEDGSEFEDEKEETVNEEESDRELTQEQIELMKKYLKTDFYDNRDYNDPEVKKEVDKIYRKITGKIGKENKDSVFDFLWKNKTDEEKEVELMNKLDIIALKQKINNLMQKKPEIAKRIFTDESLYGWNFDWNPVFIKDSPIIEEFSRVRDDTIYLGTLAEWLWLKKNNKDLYWDAYQRVLNEIFSEEFIESQREILRKEIKSELEKKFNENPELEKLWIVKHERDKLIYDWEEKLGEYFAVKVDKEILTLKDIARWLGYVIPFEEVVDFEKILTLIFWEQELEGRRNALTKVDAREEEEEQQEEKWRTIVFGDDPEVLVKADGEPTIDIESTLLGHLCAISESDVEKIMEKKDITYIKEAFLETAKKIAKCKVNFLEHPLDWISQEYRKFIIDWYRKQFPYASAELDNIWEDKNFLEDAIFDYIEQKTLEADGMFFIYEREENETWFDFCMSLLEIVDDEWRYGDFSSFFIGEVFNKFWESHEANIKIQKELTWKEVEIQIEPEEEMEEIEVKIELTPEEKEVEKYGVSLEQYKLLEKLVSKLGKFCGWDTKKKTNREMKKFAGMVADGEAFRVDDFLRDNKLDEFPEEASKILNELEVEFAYKQVGKPKKVFVPEKIVPTKKKEKKKEEKKTARKTFTKTTLTREELFANPVEGVMQSLRQNWIEILSEKDLRKQLEGYFSYGDGNKKDLIDCLLRENFWQVNKKQKGENKANYTIEVVKTGWRFLLKKISGKYFVTGFYRHDLYDKKLNGKM